MFKILLALHLLTAVFVIGPLVHITTTAARGLRTGDAAATAAAARSTRIYGVLSVLVVILGFGLMSQKAPWDKTQHVAEFSDLWIWLSVLLWLVAVAVSLAVLEPALKNATTAIEAGKPVDALKGRVAAGGGVVGLLMAAIVFLMVYQPGS